MLEAEKVKEQDALQRLQEISVKILGQLELAPLLESILQGVVDLVEADKGQLFRYDPERNELRSWVALGFPQDVVDIVYEARDSMIGQVLDTGHPLRVDDYDSWEGRISPFPKDVVGPVILAGMKRGKEWLGVLAAGRNPESKPFTDEDGELMQLFANQAAVAISNARLYEEAKGSAEELSSLYETSLEISRQLDLGQVLERIIQRAVELAKGNYGQFYLYDETRQELIPSVPYQLPEPLQEIVLKTGEGLSGKVLASRQPLIVNDYDSWEGRSPQVPPGISDRGIGAPVEHGDKVLGVLAVNRKKKDPPFTEADVRLLTLFANQAAVAIANARLYEETKRSAEELSSLYETSLELASQLELDPLLQSIIKRVVDLLEADIGELYRYDHERQELHPLIPIRLPDTAIVVMKPGEGMAGKILLSGEPLRVDDYDAWEGRAPQWPIGFTGPALGVPVKRGSEFLGVITVARNPGKKPFTEEDVDLLQLYANQVAVAIANARLYEETKRSAEELSSLYKTSLKLASQLEPEKLLQDIALRAWRLGKGRVAEILLYDPQVDALREEVLVSRGQFRPPSDFLTKLGEGLDGKVFASGKALIVDDYNTWEGRVPGIRKIRAARMAAVPIKHGGQILGTLKVRRFIEDPSFAEQDVRLLTLFANQAAVALANARLYEQTRRSAEELSSLYEASLEMAGQLEPQKLLESISLRSERLLRGQTSEIALYDPQTNSLSTAVSHGIPQAFVQMIVRPGEGVDGRVFATGEPLVIEDYNTWEGRVPTAPHAPFPRAATVPIKLGKETLGTLRVARKIEDPPFTEDEVRLLSLFANQAAVAIANARLYEGTKRSAEELSRLYETSIDITRQLAVPKLLEAIMIRAAELLYGSGGLFFLHHPDTGKLHPEFQYKRRAQTPQIPLAPGEGLAGKVYASRKPMAVEDYDTWEGRSPQWPYGQLARLAGAPMILGEKCIGVIIVDRNREDPPFNDEDLRLLSLFANQAAVALTNAQQYEELQKLYTQVQEKERLESELRVAHNIQSSLLPHELPKIRGWELGAMWTAARVISGDFYDCFPVPGGKWGFVIADVAGKGIPAALFMALCRTLVRTFCMDGRPPREAITRANDIILADAQSDWFVTLFYGLLDPKWGILTYVNAGHPPPLWYQRGTEETLGLKAEGMALGIVAGPNLEEKSVQLEAGDLLLFYTDGLSEARDAQDRLFGERRIRNLLKKFAGERPPAFLTVLQKEIAVFSQGRETSDDLTAILLKRAGGK